MLLLPYKAVVLVLNYYVTIKMMFDLRKSWYPQLKQNVNEYQLDNNEVLKKKMFEASYDYPLQVSYRKFKENVWFKWFFSFLAYFIVIYKYFLTV
jgi:hypothetical protein